MVSKLTHQKASKGQQHWTFFASVVYFQRNVTHINGYKKYPPFENWCIRHCFKISFYIIPHGIACIVWMIDIRVIYHAQIFFIFISLTHWITLMNPLGSFMASTFKFPQTYQQKLKYIKMNQRTNNKMESVVYVLK